MRKYSKPLPPRDEEKALAPASPVTPPTPLEEYEKHYEGVYPDVLAQPILDLEDPGYPLPKGIIVEKDVPVEMDDGLKLACNVFRPDKPGRFPVIMSFTTFGKDVYGWHKAYGCSEATAFEAPDPGFWVPKDYVVILFDMRGSGRSPAGGTGGGYDYYNGIEWAGIQEWSNGNVGMLGVSIHGMTQWEAAQLQPPHLKAICPWEAMTISGRYGGIPETKFEVSKAIPPHNPAWNDFVPKKRPLLPAVIGGKFTYRIALENITVPMLLCATWTDAECHTITGLRSWREISTPDKYMWLYTHGQQKWEQFYSDEAQTIQEKFFDYFLKGVDSGIMEMPRVRLEVRETLDKYTVRGENEWPIARTEYKKLYLDAVTSTLNFDKLCKEAKGSYGSADGRAVFDIKFDRDTELTGHMKLKLWVSPEESDDMYLFITMRKLDVDGNEVFVGDSWHAWKRYPVAVGFTRLSWRELDGEKSKPWLPVQKFELKGGAPQKVQPGEIIPCEIEVSPSSTLFRKGETLRLEISGRYRVDSTRYAFDDLVNEGEHSIYTGGRYDSYLLVPVIPTAQ
jgi:predicted acyl esterase